MGGGPGGNAGAFAQGPEIPQSSPDMVQSTGPDPQALSEIIQMIRGGQVGAERFMELLRLLVGSTLPGMNEGQPQQEQPQQEQSQQSGGFGFPDFGV
jgi:hypothetical protein